jgi:cytochrome c553
MLINAASEEELCLTCHSAASTGSTVDVMTGLQYAPLANGSRDVATVLGATRNGGFDEARIGSSVAYRISNATGALRTKVPVVAPQPVTSSHLAMTENGLTLPGVAWGNGIVDSGVGPTVELSCASCHNPHGNGQYRILNPVPVATATSGVFTPVVAPGVTVTDATLPPVGDTRNYTVIQTVATSPTLLASQAAAFSPTAGDYLHRGVPWDTRVNNDAPNGLPSTFNNQISAWCTACHSRYYTIDDGTNPTEDDIYKYQHNTASNRACTTCHVAHGSNALMTTDPNTGTTFAGTYAYPSGATSDSSRLLKIDRRGTCQACHDPTGTVQPNTSVGPVPVPLTP